MFKKNEGIVDRIVRVILGLLLLPVGLFLLGGLQGGAFGLVAAGFGGWVLITGLIGFCPMYLPFGINTLEKERELVARCRSMAAGCMPAGTMNVGQMCGFGSQSFDTIQNQPRPTTQDQS